MSRIYKLNAFTGSCTQKFLLKKYLLSTRFIIKNVWRPTVSMVVWLNSQPAFIMMITCEKENGNYSFRFPFLLSLRGNGGGGDGQRRGAEPDAAQKFTVHGIAL